MKGEKNYHEYHESLHADRDMRRLRVRLLAVRRLVRVGQVLPRHPGSGGVGGLWDAVEIHGKALAGPVRVAGAADGKEFGWQGETVEIERGKGRTFPPGFDQYDYKVARDLETLWGNVSIPGRDFRALIVEKGVDTASKSPHLWPRSPLGLRLPPRAEKKRKKPIVAASRLCEHLRVPGPERHLTR